MAAAALVMGAAIAAVPTSSADAAAVRPADLTVVYRSDPGAPAWSMHLLCNPSGGDQSPSAAACSALADVDSDGREPFRATPQDRVCAVEYAGPQTARVIGNWGGEQIDAAFSRTNGCENARWKMIEPVLEPARSN